MQKWLVKEKTGKEMVMEDRSDQSEAVCFSEMLVPPTRWHNPGNHNMNLHCCENLKFHIKTLLDPDHKAIDPLDTIPLSFDCTVT
jgi:hypothetical protein